MLEYESALDIWADYYGSFVDMYMTASARPAAATPGTAPSASARRSMGAGGDDSIDDGNKVNGNRKDIMPVMFVRHEDLLLHPYDVYSQVLHVSANVTLTSNHFWNEEGNSKWNSAAAV